MPNYSPYHIYKIFDLSLIFELTNTKKYENGELRIAIPKLGTITEKQAKTINDIHRENIAKRESSVRMPEPEVKIDHIKTMEDREDS